MSFFAQTAAMPPEPARPLSAEAPSQRQPKTSFWELHSAKGNSLPAANHIPYLPWLRKAAQALFAPALRCPYCKAGLGFPWLPGPC